MAGGTPAAAYGGRAELMRMIAPDGPVYQAGTLAGNPIVTAAGLATLRYLAAHPDLYQRFDRGRRESRCRDCGAALQGAGLPGRGQSRRGDGGDIHRDRACPRTGTMSPRSIRPCSSASSTPLSRRGVLLPPSPFETWFLMEAHLDGTLDTALDALADAIVETAR